MNVLEGIWRLVDSRAWNESAGRLAPVPYGTDPIGQLVLSRHRLLMSIWDAQLDGRQQREPLLSALGGQYVFDGLTLECEVAVASDPDLIGARRSRDVVLLGDDEMLWKPPTRVYGGKLERRELVWQRVWRTCNLNP